MTNVEYTSQRVQVVHGRWIEDDPIMFNCSVCGYLVNRYNNTPYCPKCGAKMGEDVVGKNAPDLVNVVRCRDCKFYYGVNEECGCNGGYHSEDWFCADGERR